MKTIEANPRPSETITLTRPLLSRHDRKRASSWRVMGSTLAGFPAFVWQLTKNNPS